MKMTGGYVHGERANFTGLILGWLAVSKPNFANKYAFEKKIEKKGTIEKRKCDRRNVAKVHTQRTPSEYRATIHCTTGTALASL